MRAVDGWAIEDQGVPSLELMERAGLGLARVTAAAAQPGPVRIVLGKGNNGGDGLVAARLLREDGHEVDVLAAVPPDELRGDAAANLERLPGPPPEPFSGERLESSGVVLDAMLGTGFIGAPREPLASAIAALNAQDVPVVACDVPSGVNASTGELEGEAVRAVATATFHASKLGLHVEPGKEHAGSVEVVPIGIPRGAPAPRERRADLRASARPLSASRARRLEVRVGRRRRGRRLGRPHGRAHDGGALGLARRRRLRAGGRAGAGSAGHRHAAARADEPRPTR